MPTPKKGARLGGSAAHQKLILANLATSLHVTPVMLLMGDRELRALIEIARASPEDLLAHSSSKVVVVDQHDEILAW